jgi:putative ABC transport system ATP-binding protein
VITGHGLGRTYTVDGVDREVLRGVDLEIGADEFVAIMGPSGCGKSTLLQLLGGLDVPTSGHVMLSDGGLGADDLGAVDPEAVDLGAVDLGAIGAEARAAVRRERIGFVFQQFHLIPSLTVIENVALTAIVSGVRPRQWRPRAVELLDALGLGRLATVRPSRLSGGEQQRVAIARALFHDPDVLLADEPTGSLDSENGQIVLDLVLTARRIGRLRSVVMVTHDPDAASVADRVVFMRDGRMVGATALRDLEGVARAEHVRIRLASTSI